MSRPPRTVHPGSALHVVQRGNNRVDCFIEVEDRRRYLFLLAELAAKFECLVHAYCLMSNHVHLLITPQSAPMCSAMMRELGQRYTRYFNRRYARTGTLWEGRYRSCLVETTRYVIGCYRYVEMNPVKPGIVDDPVAYEWSSHAGNTGRRVDPLLTPHAEFVALGLDAEARYRAYLELVRQSLDASVVAAIRKATHGGLRLGG